MVGNSIQDIKSTLESWAEHTVLDRYNFSDTDAEVMEYLILVHTTIDMVRQLMMDLIEDPESFYLSDNFRLFRDKLEVDSNLALITQIRLLSVNIWEKRASLVTDLSQRIRPEYVLEFQSRVKALVEFLDRTTFYKTSDSFLEKFKKMNSKFKINFRNDPKFLDLLEKVSIDEYRSDSMRLLLEYFLTAYDEKCPECIGINAYVLRSLEDDINMFSAFLGLPFYSDDDGDNIITRSSIINLRGLAMLGMIDADFVEAFIQKHKLGCYPKFDRDKMLQGKARDLDLLLAPPE